MNAGSPFIVSALCVINLVTLLVTSHSNDGTSRLIRGGRVTFKGEPMQ